MDPVCLESGPCTSGLHVSGLRLSGPCPSFNLDWQKYTPGSAPSADDAADGGANDDAPAAVDGDANDDAVDGGANDEVDGQKETGPGTWENEIFDLGYTEIAVFPRSKSVPARLRHH